MHCLPLLKSGAQRPVQTIFQIQLAPPGHDVRKQVAVEGRVLLQQCLKIKCSFGRHQLIQPHLVRRDGSPLLLHVPMIWIRP